MTAEEFVDRFLDVQRELGTQQPPPTAAVCGLIDAVLQDERLAAMPELLPVRLPSAAPTSWWQAHPPRHAGPELAADLKAQYGIDVDVIET